jgi:ZIP family zinc transporter
VNDLGFVAQSFVAGILASLACGLGALPLAIPALKLSERAGLAYAFAGGLMFSASVYNLLMPALSAGADDMFHLKSVLLTLLGLFLGCFCLWSFERFLTPERLQRHWLSKFGGRTEVLIFLAMTFHSIPEGIAVGVGYGAESTSDQFAGMGLLIALAIAIHNIPEGLAVAVPMRARGAPIAKCAFFAFLTSLPQPIAAVPASLMVWLFQPLLIPSLGFAAGAMMYLVIVELIPDALKTHPATQTAWMFMSGFALMLLVQVLIS